MATSKPIPIAVRFPNLATTGGYAQTSEPSENYNCFAFAAGDSARWWDGIHYWPAGVVID